jgi:hypothetical protein
MGIVRNTILIVGLLGILTCVIWIGQGVCHVVRKCRYDHRLWNARLNQKHPQTCKSIRSQGRIGPAD